MGGGSSGTTLLKLTIFDICVLDIMLPGINGFDLAKKIKLKEPYIPILFLTAKDQTEDVIKAIRLVMIFMFFIL